VCLIAKVIKAIAGTIAFKARRIQPNPEPLFDPAPVGGFAAKNGRADGEQQGRPIIKTGLILVAETLILDSWEVFQQRRSR
jgi:hypothetical protein